MSVLETEHDLVSAALALGARRVRGWSPGETRAAAKVKAMPAGAVAPFLEEIRCGADPLGTAFCRLRPSEIRRDQGAVYTPPEIVRYMVASAGERVPNPRRIVEPGAGSARFLAKAGRRFPAAVLVGIETDPVAAMLARANLASAGLAERAEIIVSDYRSISLPKIEGVTLFLGNPPYVRHHQIAGSWKSWFSERAATVGLRASQLAGLHVHFFLATLLHAKAGDIGCLITASEWLDVNYGRLVRELLLGPLGGTSLTIIEPKTQPFSDAATTGVISTFVIGSQPASVQVRRVSDLRALTAENGLRTISRGRLERETRWSNLTRSHRAAPSGFVELGELCQVHRGQVTGANHIWIAGKQSEALLPGCVLFSCVTRARELFAAGPALADSSHLRRVIDIPADLTILNEEARRPVERFLKQAKQAGAAAGYIASHRNPWWAVRLRAPAPILATYMARRPPAFVRNIASARHINVAHGLYPREPLDDAVLDRLAAFLTTSTQQADGRTYAGGLTKFEPGEIERLMVPSPRLLRAGGFSV